MSKIIFSEQTAPATPATGLASLYVDSATGKLATKDDAGTIVNYGVKQLIEDKLLVATATQFDFQSIPATYKDLVIELYVRTDAAGVNVKAINWEVNGDTGTNYDKFTWQGSHSAVTATTENFGIASTDANNFIAYAGGATSAANYFSRFTITITNYVLTTGYKTVETRGSVLFNNTTGLIRIFDSVGVWKSTSAINRFRLFLLSSGNFVVGSRATLYGVG